MGADDLPAGDSPESGTWGTYTPEGDTPAGRREPARSVRLSLRGNDLLVQPAAGPLGKDEQDALRRSLAAVSPSARTVYDRRLGAYRTVASAFRSVREQLERAEYDVSLAFDPAPALPFALRLGQEPREYQREALAAWEAAGRRGVVVLPTGSGKTLVALMAIAQLGTWTLVVVPTLDLLTQWRRTLAAVLGAPGEYLGVFGGGRQEIRPLTVMTYDSAAIHTRLLNQFGLLVFDEVHHLPASSYRLAAEGAVAPFRLGLSATPERSDGLESDLRRLVGPVVYARTPQALRRHLAAYREQRIPVALDGEERATYTTALATYRDYLRSRRLRITSPEDFQRLVVWPSASNAEARAAMLAHREARRLAFNARSKRAIVLELLARHRDDRVVLFSEFNSVVEELSRDLLIPCITHKTPAAEREAVLDGFRAGRLTKLATGRVLNEGVDVPDANVAIILSGSGTRREYIQRLGRVLRPKSSPAVLYELVTDETSETHLNRRRHAEPGAAPGAGPSATASAIRAKTAAAPH